jgi:hypothetical protein
MRCRGIELVVAVLVVLGWALPGCAKVKDVVATKAPLGGDAAAKDASVDAGGTAPIDAGVDCKKCQQDANTSIWLNYIWMSGCVVPPDRTGQQLLFMFLDDKLGMPSPRAERRQQDICDGNPAGYPHDYQDATRGHVLCPWYCDGAMMWVDSHPVNVAACAPCFASGAPRQ